MGGRAGADVCRDGLFEGGRARRHLREHGGGDVCVEVVGCARRLAALEQPDGQAQLADRIDGVLRLLHAHAQAAEGRGGDGRQGHRHRHQHPPRVQPGERLHKLGVGRRLGAQTLHDGGERAGGARRQRGDVAQLPLDLVVVVVAVGVALGDVVLLAHRRLAHHLVNQLRQPLGARFEVEPLPAGGRAHRGADQAAGRHVGLSVA